jgi:LacI family transcriptional regulator
LHLQFMKKKRAQAPTIRRVAEAAGVSLGTVSRVLNAKGNVSPEIQATVNRVIGELGYRPNVAAQTMRSEVSRTVACVIRDSSVAGFAQFVRAADEVLSLAGYTLMLANSAGRIDRELELISRLTARRVDALLIAQSSEANEAFGMRLQETGIPVVLIDREKPAWADSVMLDHRAGTRQATEKLLQLGHRRIALLTGQPTLYPASERIIGYEQAFAAASLPVDRQLIRTGGFEAKFGFEQTSMLLYPAHRPTAIISGGIDMLPGIIRAIRARGLSIPADVSVVGSMNSDLADLHQPPISVEDWDYSEVGRIGANLALHRISTGQTREPRRVLVPTRFLVRESIARLGHDRRQPTPRKRRKSGNAS